MPDTDRRSVGVKKKIIFLHLYELSDTCRTSVIRVSDTAIRSINYGGVRSKVTTILFYLFNFYLCIIDSINKGIIWIFTEEIF